MLQQPQCWLPPRSPGCVQVPHKCLLDLGTDESASEGMLATALAILSEVHKSVFAASAPGQVRRLCVSCLPVLAAEASGGHTCRLCAVPEAAPASALRMLPWATQGGPA